MSKTAKHIIATAAAAVIATLTVAAVVMRMVFPNKYSARVCAAADEFGLDRALVKSVVWAESRYDRKAVSPKGAKGLMQLMPETYEACAAALGIQTDEAAMLDVDNSLRCGCYYLSLLIERFDGDVTAALMAYNAGESNARKFLNGEKVFPETRLYLANIKKANKIYGLFY